MPSQELADKLPDEVPIYKEIILETPIADFQWYGTSKIIPENRIELSRVNIFVGANNSGKSRALRAIFQSEFSYVTNLITIEEIRVFVNIIIKEFEPALGNSFKFQNSGNGYETLKKLTEYENNYNKFIKGKGNREISDLFTEVLEYFNNIISENSFSKIEQSNTNDSEQFKLVSKNIKEIFEKHRQKILEYQLKNHPTITKRIYIPVLRGMRPLPDKTNFYEERTKEDYFYDRESRQLLLREGMEIFTGLELYKDLRSKLLGESKDWKKIRDYEIYLSKKFFQGEEVTLIPKEKASLTDKNRSEEESTSKRESEDVIYIKIGAEDQRPIYELGDGIQNLIILTYKMFTEESCLFFIEEPELFMHPGMQRIFIEALNLFKTHQFFLVTHSNHILDMSLDHSGISIFHFNKSIEEEKSVFKVKNVSNDDQRVLKDLGILNSSVFLSNSTIWIEGITDRKYIKFFMDRYLESIGIEHKNYVIFSKYKEDLHYSFVIYQGGGLAHWDFSEDSDSKEIDEIKASFVCANAIVIADGDAETKPRGKKTKEILGEKCYFLPTKEIENILPADFILDFCKKTLNSDDISAKIIRADYEKLTVGLGGYLDSLFDKEKPYFGKDMSETSKKLDPSAQEFIDAKLSRTLKEDKKKILCNFTISNFNTYKLKSEEDKYIIKLCEIIFAHIAECNGDKPE